jgi:hypothetical protein
VTSTSTRSISSKRAATAHWRQTATGISGRDDAARLKPQGAPVDERKNRHFVMLVAVIADT